MKIIVGITGASGSIYAITLLRELFEQSLEVFGVCSDAGKIVMKEECGVSQEDFPFVNWYNSDDMFSLPASGSNFFDGMVIVPCSMNTLSCVANGLSNNLLQRAATVMLKESRKLVVVPRETPLSIIQIEAMSKLAAAGTIILPAAPAFYKKPNSIQDLVNFITNRITAQFIKPTPKQ
ncbi:MAG: UbiX family flavin prenyltransferase [Planctomycetaceae bacterium]|jgi:4-hydroxy-3-polyprenylbenzoate decarboxylase|nr:UbiX family flavin prenyltransferase [Planctomycetaceae bacterium]